MHHAGDQTDEPVLPPSCCWPQHPSLSRPVPFKVCGGKEGTRPARADALHSLRANMPHLLSSPLSPDRYKVRKKHDFLQKLGFFRQKNNNWGTKKNFPLVVKSLFLRLKLLKSTLGMVENFHSGN